MYTKDLTNKIIIRLNDKQMAFVQDDADLLGVSVSDYMRMMINTSMCLAQKAKEKLANANIKVD